MRIAQSKLFPGALAVKTWQIRQLGKPNSANGLHFIIVVYLPFSTYEANPHFIIG